ncbi:hypothetical protein LF1_03620 [Rubripirellula obstinata]|uniref:Uncharacterized protein n=1 Tax=Rubripirellula obstinata TaxID=406547 RepID=A0A5B1CCC4_9BACT|nr:hypothetical protein LF1_03620 [Rubripirellula obstinata]
MKIWRDSEPRRVSGRAVRMLQPRTRRGQAAYESVQLWNFAAATQINDRSRGAVKAHCRVRQHPVDVAPRIVSSTSDRRLCRRSLVEERSGVRLFPGATHPAPSFRPSGTGVQPPTRRGPAAYASRLTFLYAIAKNDHSLDFSFASIGFLR